MGGKLKFCWLFLVVGLLLFLFRTVETKAQSVLSITNISDNKNSYPNSTVPRYGKLEIRFDVANTVAKNLQFPYDSAPPAGVTPSVGISVDAEFSPDNWATVYKQPAFFYQEYSRQAKDNQDWVYPTGDAYWVVRFAPNKEGVWRYRLAARDASGSVQSNTYQFSVGSSSNRGFVRVSQNDSRYFEFEDGTFFPGLGYNMNFDAFDWKNPVLSNQNNLRVMGQNGIEFIRIWLSQWQIFGEQWNAWKYMHDGGEWSHLRSHQSYPGDANSLASEVSMRLAMSSDGPPCISSGHWLQAPLALKQNTRYRVKARVKTVGLSGPVQAGKPYGFVVKTGDIQGEGRCQNPDLGTRMTTSLSQNRDWTTVEGTYNSGNSNYLWGIYVTLENLSAGEAYVDYVWVEEDLGDWGSQPNILAQPWMAHHMYYDQRMSYAFDLALNLAEQNNVYLKPVLTEKNDWTLNSIDFDGNFTADKNNAYFYGDWRRVTKTRWLLQSWWRYAQARWGYSTAIHSWELLNEGDPWSGMHFTQADEFGKYMHCTVFGQSVINTDGWRCSYKHPNSHPVTTSTWAAYPVGAFWSHQNFPNVDIADFHLYYLSGSNAITETDKGNFTISTPSTWYDTALIASNQSQAIGALTAAGADKPTVIGETSFVAGGSGSSVVRDTAGVWLHNFLWGGIVPGGVYNSGYWYIGDIYGGTKDLRPIFGNFYRFIKNIPLNNGHYVDIAATSSNSNLRAWGQKDTANKRAHLWISNKNHTWKNVVDGVSIAGENGIVTIGGFSANTSYKLEKWDTYRGVVSQSSSINSNSSGNIIFSVSNLTSDEAYKIGDYGTSITATPTANPGDANGDGLVDGADYVIWLNHYNQDFAGPQYGDFNNSGRVDGVDYATWLIGYDN